MFTRFHTFRTTLVGDDPISSNQVKQCIRDWVKSGPNAVQSLPIGDSYLTVCLTQCILIYKTEFHRLIITQVSVVEEPSTGTSPAVIGIVVVLVIAIVVGVIVGAIVLAVVIIKRKDKDLRLVFWYDNQVYCMIIVMSAALQCTS